MPSWKKVIISGSSAALTSVIATSGFTGSLLGTASFASTASFVNTLNQNVIITSSLAVGTSSLGPSENTITLGARDASSEGGQIGFNAPGGTYTSASFIDNWQNKARILKGNNTTSTGLIAQWDIHTTQMQLPGYTAASSFPGTATANLAVDSGGNVITVSTTGGSVFPYVGNAVITGSLTTTGIIYAQPNGGMYFQGGDDAALYDINVVNTMGVYGVQDSTVGSIKLGSGGGTISGKSGNIGIGTINPSSASLTINGNVWATSFTGSLLGTASFASQALSSSFATTASYALNTLTASYAATASSALNAQDILIYVKNLTGTQINKGTVVRISGATGDNALISTASYTDDNNSANTLGITNQDIPHDSFGYVMTEGKLLGINTDAFSAGQLLYLGATGSIIGTAPVAPLHGVRLGQVLRVQAINGSMYVRIDNGYELGELHDVVDTTTTSSFGDLLVKSGSVWTNSRQLTGSYGLTGSLNATSFTGSLLGTASFALTASYVVPTTTNAFVQGGNSFGTTALLGTNDNQPLAFETNGSTRMFISSSGNVGIGTITPASSLDVNGQIQSNSGLNLDKTSGQTQIYFRENGTLRSQFTSNYADGNFYFYHGGANRMMISSSGNVGIGTTNPTSTLQVNGTFNSLALWTNSSAITSWGNSGAVAFGGLTWGTGYAMVYSTAGNNLYFGTNGSSTRMVIDTSGNVGILSSGTPSSRLQVRGSGTTSATTAFRVENSNTSASLTITDDLNSQFYGNVGIRRAATASLDIAGTTRISGSFNTATSGSILTIIGSGSAQPIFTVQGSQGELFSITDSLSGSLFSVNDISGLPVLEAFSDNTVLIGNYQDPMLITTAKVVQSNSGSFTVYSLPTASYDTAFFEYSIKSGSNARAGTIMAIQSGTSVNFTETTTTDFGNTSAVSFTVIVTGSNMALTGSSTSGAWTIKTIVRGL